MATTALVAIPMTALAQDATWAGPGTSITDGANWSTGSVPTGTATFGGAAPTNPRLLTPGTGTFLSLGETRFLAGAPAYTVTLGTLGPPRQEGELRLTGAGISDLSGQARFDLVAGRIALLNNATLGTAIIGSTTSGTSLREISLQDNARGGTARLDNVTLNLRETASAERLVLNGEVNAGDNSTLGNATITIAALTGTTRGSLVAGNASLGAARITIADGPNNILRVGQNATGGTAAVTVLGAGRFDISLHAGPTFNIGSLAGDGRVLLGTNTLLLDGPGSTFAGVLEGAGGSGLTIASGTTTLTGTSTFSGNILVMPGGTLLINGNTQSAGVIFVETGGTLGGTGTVGRTSVDGTLSPGSPASPIGTLNVQGDVAIGRNGTLRLDVSPGGADSLNVSRAAILEGTLQVVPAAGALPTNGQSYTIVQAGQVLGSFKRVTDPLAYYDFTPVYTGTQVNLVVSQLPFNNPAATNGVRNLVQKSAALDGYRASATSNADFNAVLGQLLGLSPGEATRALHSMSGEAYASFTTVGLEQLDRFRYATLDAAGSCEGRGGQMRGRWCAWLDGYYVNASLNGAGDLAGFRYRLSGMQGGVETRLQPDSVIGFTLGYGNQRASNFDYSSRRITGDALFAGIYGTHGMGPWQVAGLFGYSRFDVDGERDIGVGNIARQARSSFGADGVNAALALRYRADVGRFRIEPEALLAYTQYWQDGFTETGAGSLNLRVNGTDSNSFVTGIGVRASTEFDIQGRMVRPFALLRYERDWLAGARDDHRVTASFAQVPEAGSWTVFGQNRGRDNLIGRIGVVGEVAANVALFGTVGGQLNSNGSEWGVGGGVRVTF